MFSLFLAGFEKNYVEGYTVDEQKYHIEYIWEP